MNSKDILIIEDDTSLLRILELELKYENYTFDIAKDGREGLDLFEKNEYKLILLDIMIPKINGLELCRKIRKQSNIHIIMMTAKRDVTDRVVGLDTGADDYITKPFEIEELLARIRSVLRRIEMNEKELKTLELDDLKIDIMTRQVTKEGDNIELTKKEYELLEYLVNNKNIVLTRDQIINNVWGYDFVGDTNILDVYIRYLRNKIDYPYNSNLIQTVRGVGYTVRSKR